jgi:hypothetical protein
MMNSSAIEAETAVFLCPIGDFSIYGAMVNWYGSKVK